MTRNNDKFAHYKDDMKPTESQIQNAIRTYLEMRGVYVIRVNSGSIPIGTGKYKRWFKGADAGTPDLVACHNGKFIGIEVKRPTKKQTDRQIYQAGRIERAGGVSIVATSIEDIQKLLQI